VDQEDFPTEDEGQELPIESGEEPQSEVRMVTRKFNGDEYEMPEHLAQVWDERNASYVRQLTEQAERIRREALQQTPPRQQQAPPDPQDPDTEWYAAPSKMWEIKERQLRQELVEELDRREAQRVFWSDFRSENPDLAGKDTIVRAVLNERLNEMRYMSAEEGRAYLAEATRSLLNGDTPRVTRRTTTSDRPVDSPPARTSQPRQQKAPPKEETGSLQASIKAMQAEKRRHAQFNFPEKK